MADQEIDIRIKTSVDNAEGAKTISEVKSSLKELNSLALEFQGTNQEAFDQVTAAAAKLQDKVEDVKESIGAMKGDGLEPIANSFGLMAQGLLALDFDKATSGANMLTQAIQNFSLDDISAKFQNFKLAIDNAGDALGEKLGPKANDTLKGLGNVVGGLGTTFTKVFAGDLKGALGGLGQAFNGLGAIIKANPIMTLVTVISLIIANLDTLTKMGGLVGEVFKAIGEIVAWVTDAFFALTDALGLTNKAETERHEKAVKDLEEEGEAAERYYKNRIALAQAMGDQTYTIERESLDKKIELENKHIDELKKSGQAYTEEGKAELAKRKINIEQYQAEVEVLNEKTNQRIWQYGRDLTDRIKLMEAEITGGKAKASIEQIKIAKDKARQEAELERDKNIKILEFMKVLNPLQAQSIQAQIDTLREKTTTFLDANEKLAQRRISDIQKNEAKAAKSTADQAKSAAVKRYNDQIKDLENASKLELLNQTTTFEQKFKAIEKNNVAIKAIYDKHWKELGLTQNEYELRTAELGQDILKKSIDEEIALIENKNKIIMEDESKSMQQRYSEVADNYIEINSLYLENWKKLGLTSDELKVKLLASTKEINDKQNAILQSRLEKNKEAAAKVLGQEYDTTKSILGQLESRLAEVQGYHSEEIKALEEAEVQKVGIVRKMQEEYAQLKASEADESAEILKEQIDAEVLALNTIKAQRVSAKISEYRDEIELRKEYAKELNALEDTINKRAQEREQEDLASHDYGLVKKLEALKGFHKKEEQAINKREKAELDAAEGNESLITKIKEDANAARAANDKKYLEQQVQNYATEVNRYLQYAAQLLGAFQSLASTVSENENIKFEETRRKYEDEIASINEKEEYEIAYLERSKATELAQKNLTEEEKVKIEKKYSDKLNALKTNNAIAEGKLKEKLSKEETALKKKQFNREKAFALVSAAINTAIGVTAALSQAPPYSYILAGITAAAGLVQIAAIASKKFDEGGGSGGSTVETPNIDPAFGSGATTSASAGVSGGTLYNLGQTPTTNSSGAGPNGQRVYVVESDITDTQKKVQVIQQNAQLK